MHIVHIHVRYVVLPLSRVHNVHVRLYDFNNERGYYYTNAQDDC